MHVQGDRVQEWLKNSWSQGNAIAIACTLRYDLQDYGHSLAST